MCVAPLGFTMNDSFSRRGSLASAPMQHPLEILVADADAGCRTEMTVAVKALGYECQVARTGAEALAMQRRHAADILLIDSALQGMTGLDLCRAIRAQGSSPYTYIVFLTSHGDKEDLLEAMRAGADGYLRKPVDLDELEVRLEAGRRVVGRNRTLETNNRQLRRKSERALRAASVDVLTEVSSRRQLEEDLAVMQSRAVRYGHRYCAALCDIDGFKHHNDRFGHLAGDEALRAVAGAIRSALRRGDGLYRYGGDEFLAILPEQSLLEASAVMERVRIGVEALRLPDAPSGGEWVTISVGIAESRRAPPETIESWLRRADTALYAAKAGGRNRVLVDAGSSSAA
jgi:two-component system cell cycle response regulator